MADGEGEPFDGDGGFVRGLGDQRADVDDVLQAFGAAAAGAADVRRTRVIIAPSPNGSTTTLGDRSETLRQFTRRR